MTIDTCIIVKNEEKNIENLINQLLIFSNEIHITDTGSTDNTINIINKYREKYKNVFLHHFKWCMDFSKARNYSFNCYKSKADYIFWCDADDELNEELIKSLQEFVKSNNKNDSIYEIKYKYSNDYTYTLYRSALLKISEKFIWKDPIHEYIIINTRQTRNYTLFDNGSLIIHKRINFKENLDRNLEIFMNMEKTKYKFDARNKFLYARELYNHKMYQQATHYFIGCINADEKNDMAKINSCIYLLLMDNKDSPDYFFKLFKEDIYRKDLFYYIGNYYFDRTKFKLARFYYILCDKCEEPEEDILFNYDKSCLQKALNQIDLIDQIYE